VEKKRNAAPPRGPDIAACLALALGGNANLIGAAANVAAVGICGRRGERVSFGQFMRYGVPITVAQLAAGALYVLVFAALLR
jgi:Na+/H+ antiporter NhaD/arsenite permease-like protein